MTLTFEPEPHVYRWNGYKVPNVTSITGPLLGLEFVDADVLARAAAFGTAVHKMTEYHDLRELDLETLDLDLVGHLDGWKSFINDFAPIFEAIEIPAYSARYHFAGTADRVVRLSKGKATLKRDVLAVLDIKSGTTTGPAVGVQLAAYQQALNEGVTRRFPEKITHRCSVNLVGDGKYKFEWWTDPSDWSMFMSSLTIKNWRLKHGFN